MSLACIPYCLKLIITLVDIDISITRVTNKADPNPILPGRFLGYEHSSGEAHILNSTAWYSCEGQCYTLSSSEFLCTNDATTLDRA